MTLTKPDKKIIYKIINLKRKNIPEIDISKIVGISQYAVKKYYFDIVQTILLLKKEGLPLINISNRLGIGFPKVKEILIEELKENYPFRTKISSQLKKMIITLAEEGDSIRLISKKTKVSINSVKKIVEKPFHYIYDLIMAKTQLENHKNLKGEAYTLFQEVRNKIKKGRSYRNESRLSPIVIYLFLKITNIDFHLNDLLNAVGLTLADFKKGLNAVLPYCLEYKKRNRKTITHKKIVRINDIFNLSPQFLYVSDILLERLWPLICNTREEIIAGVISILTIIKLSIQSVNYIDLCSELGIGMSSVFYNVKNKILAPQQIEGFTGFRSSTSVLLPIL